MIKLLGLLAVLFVVLLSPEHAPAQQEESSPGVCHEDRCYHYLAHWEWHEEIDEGSREITEEYWRCPSSGCVGLLDLRSIPQMASPGDITGYGWFVYSSEQDICELGCRHYGTDVSPALGNADNPVSLTRLTRLETELGVELRGGTVPDILWEMVTQHADPSGGTRWRPVMPAQNGRLALHLGGHSLIREEIYDPAAHPLVLENVKHDYERIRAEYIARDSDHYLKVLGAYEDKYERFGVTARDIHPTDVAREPETRIEDTFVGDNGDPIHNRTATGADGGFTWTLLTDPSGNNWTIQNNRLAAFSSDIARAEIDLSSDDHRSGGNMFDWAGSDSRFRPVVRFAASAETGYYFDRRNRVAGGLAIRKLVNGVESSLTDDNAPADDLQDPYLYFTEAAGSTIDGLEGETIDFDGDYSGNVVITTTDTSITGNVRTGVRRSSGSWTLSSWEAEDIEAPDPPDPPSIERRRLIQLVRNLTPWGWPGLMDRHEIDKPHTPL